MSDDAPDTLLEKRISTNVPLREVRFAVTLVGGTSLAIYECGAAVELYRMMRGDGVYGLLKRLTNSHALVDILSGTSAGGINAISLATAIANGADIAPAKAIWERDAGVDDLLQRPEEGRASTLFRGNTYYLDRFRDLFGALTRSETPKEGGIPSGFPGNSTLGYDLDLFITGTYYQGQNRAYLDLSGQPIFTADFNGVFHLQHRPRDGKSHFRADLPDPGDEGWKVEDKKPRPRTDDRAAEPVVERLSRVGRTTSSLPAIFEPSAVTLADVGNTITLPQTPGGTHWLFDGGFLNNRPIDLALNEVFRRTATREVARKFLFVEPVAVECRIAPTEAVPEPNAAQAVGFFATVPGNQSISDSLQQLAAFNRRVVDHREQVRRIRERRILMQPDVTQPERDIWRQIRRDDLLESAKDAFLKGAGLERVRGVLQASEIDFAVDLKQGEQALRAYAHVESAFSAWRRTIAAPSLDLQTLGRWIDSIRIEVRECRFPRKNDGTVDVHQRQERYEASVESEEDIEHALRSLYRLKTDLDKEREERRKAVETMGKSLRPRLFSADAVTPEEIQAYREEVAAWIRDDGARAEASVKAVLTVCETLAGYLKDILEKVPDGSNGYFRWALDGRCRDWLETLDIVLYPYLRLAQFEGESPVDVVYVSARSRQRELSRRNPKDKLAGDELFNLGGFLKRSWRVNDILWGQLDAADALCDALLEPARLERLDLERDPATGFRAKAIEAIAAYAFPVDSALNPLVARGLEGWEQAIREAPDPKSLAEALARPLLRRHQLELVEAAVPDAVAAELAEYHEQATQNLAPKPLGPSERLPGIATTMRALYPIPTVGSGSVVDQLFRSAREEVERNKARATKPIIDAFDIEYQVGAESVQGDIPLLVSLQRLTQTVLLLLQIAGKLVPDRKWDRLFLFIPRGITWVVYGFFLAMRQGKAGRTAAIAAALAAMVLIPLAFVFGLVVDKAQVPLGAAWVCALALGAAVAHLRRGPAASVAWTTFGLLCLLGAFAGKTKVVGIWGSAMVFGAGSLLLLMALGLFFDALAGERATTDKRFPWGRFVAIVTALGLLATNLIFLEKWAGAKAWAPWLAVNGLELGPIGASLTAVWIVLVVYQAIQDRGLSTRLEVVGTGDDAAKLLQYRSRKEVDAERKAMPAEGWDALVRIAGSEDEADRRIQRRASAEVDGSRRALRADQWMVLVYVAALSVALLGVLGAGVHEVDAMQRGQLLWLGLVGTFVAGGLDYTENLCLFAETEACGKQQVVVGRGTTRLCVQVHPEQLDRLARVARWCAWTKFVLLAAVGGLIGFAIVRYMGKTVEPPTTPSLTDWPTLVVAWVDRYVPWITAALATSALPGMLLLQIPIGWERWKRRRAGAAGRA